MSVKKPIKRLLGKPISIWWLAARRVVMDLATLNFTLFASLLLLSREAAVSEWSRFLVPITLPLNVLALLLFIARRTYRISSRYFGVVDIANLGSLAVLLGFALHGLQLLMDARYQFGDALTLTVMFTLMSGTLFSLARMFGKAFTLRNLLPQWSRLASNYKRVLIVGAGDAGESVLRDLNRMTSNQHWVVAFVDDVETRLNTTIHGVPVAGTTRDLPDLIERHAIDEVMVAMPEAAGSEIRRILELCAETKARIRTLPSVSALVEGDGQTLPLMRELQVEDLLRRESVAQEIQPSTSYVRGETVLVSGGGGSIGSELARQVSALQPANLLLLGKGENSIFEIDQELRSQGFSHSTPIICDVRDVQALESVFQRHNPSVVFHAAAHKHVPLMEAVPIEAIRNNVFGTLAIAERSIRFGVKRFILVSTDKAVNPSNVMGASKRVAEMIVTSLAARSETGFSAVRFGNVLGSRGSLVPILSRQIKNGGPVTITHPEMTRFFMTIPEAAKLIVSAGSMGDQGEIFILDMGDPVSIVDIAKDMIRMHGLVPGKDIAITYTGIRPGEKIHEELACDQEELETSANDKIQMVANNRPVEWEWLRFQLDELRRICDSGDSEAARAFLMDLAWGKNVPPVPFASRAVVEG